jgi:hypothetical protein
MLASPVWWPFGGWAFVRAGHEQNASQDGAGKKKDIESRVTQLKAQVEETSSDHEWGYRSRS